MIEALVAGFNGESFSDIAAYLLTGRPVADPYMCMADFDSYCKIHEEADSVYRNREQWAKMSLHNIASAGVFSADRSIREYAERIWYLRAL